MKSKYISSIIFAIFFIFGSAQGVFAQTSSSTNYFILNPVIDSGLGRSTSSNFGLGASLSQVAPGKSVSSSFQLLSGFQYFYFASPNTITATPGNSQVSLSWTTPQVFLGAVISGYEIGVGTVSGVYSYESVGNVTNFVKTGLSNGITYFFKVRAKTATGNVLSVSNEASAVPVAGVASPGLGGGGGGSSLTGSLSLEGFAAPSSKVVVLHNGSEISNTISQTNGRFNIVLNGLREGVYNLALYYFDPEGFRSDFVNVRVVIQSQKSSASKDIFLPPTIKADKSEVRSGDSIRIFGYAYPSSSVLLYSSSETPLTTQAGLDGKYTFDFPTQNLVKGFYSVKSKAVVSNLSSSFSSQVKFLVGTENILSPELGACPAKADFNKDCRVNLIDFSILAYWFENAGFPDEIDLNKDQRVDLVDFSILAYYWTD
ncbi:MAG: fibronectin type III domain-containing protein [Candidatus Doudnabacteria bacterium]|nr:fibronectin type III domain-containing protein [Candidatus Doudnabacteria bacterium]